MMIEWEPIDHADIPPKGEPRDEKRYVGRIRDKRGKPWTKALDAFLGTGHVTARAVYDIDDLTADAVQSSLNSAIGQTHRMKHLRSIRRGDDVYVTMVPRPARLDAGALRDVLFTAEREGRAEITEEDVPLDMMKRVYHSLHYHRTREGLGNITVSLTRDKRRIILFDTMLQDEEA